MAQPDSTSTAPAPSSTAAPSPVDDLLARLSLNTSPHPHLAPAALPPLPALPVPSLTSTLAPPPLPLPSPSPSSSSPASSPPASSRPFVLFQPACALHRYARTADIGTIVERPERLRAVKTGVAAAWARLELEREGGGGALAGAADAGAAGAGAAAREWERKDDGGAEGLDALLEGLSLGSAPAPAPAPESGSSSSARARARGALEVVGGAFDILSTGATLRVDDAALRVVHPVPNRAPGVGEGDDDDDGWSTASSTSPLPPPPRADSGHPSSSPSRPPTSAPLPWPSQLLSLCRASATALLSPSPDHPHPSEIPPHLPQGDLYLCPGSEGAIFGALGAACEGVDRAVRGARERGGRRGFVAVRPPGHHCGESSPQGFCFVNNVAVAAAHAHIKHGINRVIILDIDLHHGNGTQEIVYRLNADAQRVVAAHERALAAAEKDKARTSPRKGSPRKGAAAAAVAAGRAAREGDGAQRREEREQEKEKEKEEREAPRPLRVMYGSVHDIWSYPCEDADPHLVAAASTLLAGAHGQHISNVHLDPFRTEREFHEKLYPRYWDALGGRAEEFCRGTEARGEETLVLVSAGFDASQHESPGMSRHARNVPTSFYRRFARDAVALAERCAQGKLVGVLEGGYSDWALASGAGAFLSGLVGEGEGEGGGEGAGEGGEGWEAHERDAWWAEASLKKLDKACSLAKPRRGAASSSSTSSASTSTSPAAQTLVGASPADAASDPWLARAVDIFSRIEDRVALAPPPSLRPPPPPSSSAAAAPQPRQLRERKVRHNYAGLDDGSTPIASPERAAQAQARRGAPASSAAAALPPPVPFVPSVPATTMAPAPAPAGKVEDESGATAQGTPAVRFTWKQGGFGGEPRM
ncbi:hypothetical protein JCM9279_003276 [Rhodotorula babjevae]